MDPLSPKVVRRFLASQDEAQAGEREADVPKKWEPVVKELKKDKDVDNPFALVNWMEGEGYKPHKK